MYVKIDGNSDLLRDLNSGAIINKNSDAFTTAIKAKQRRQNLETKVSKLETDVADINKKLDLILQHLNG
jgi:tetrahydromethanopterin S-methyltransferase subunit B